MLIVGMEMKFMDNGITWGSRETNLINQTSDAMALLAEHNRLQKEGAKNYYDNGRVLFFLFQTRKFCDYDHKLDASKPKYEFNLSEFERFLYDHGAMTISRDELTKRMKVFEVYHECAPDVIEVVSQIGISKALFAVPYVAWAKKEGRHGAIKEIVDICYGNPHSDLANRLSSYSNDKPKKNRKSKDALANERERRAITALEKTHPTQLSLLCGDMFVPRREHSSRKDEARYLGVFEVLRERQGLTSIDDTFEWVINSIEQTFSADQKIKVAEIVQRELSLDDSELKAAA